jgi:selenoprotein W-related protein
LSGLILSGFKRRIQSLELIPDAGGCFEVTVNEELIYSKLATKEFPKEAAILDIITTRLKGAQAS